MSGRGLKASQLPLRLAYRVAKGWHRSEALSTYRGLQWVQHGPSSRRERSARAGGCCCDGGWLSTARGRGAARGAARGPQGQTELGVSYSREGRTGPKTRAPEIGQTHSVAGLAMAVRGSGGARGFLLLTGEHRRANYWGGVGSFDRCREGWRRYSTP